MAPHFVPPGDDLPDEIRVLAGILRYHKEGSRNSPLGQDFQNKRCKDRVGTIVKGQGYLIARLPLTEYITTPPSVPQIWQQRPYCQNAYGQSLNQFQVSRCSSVDALEPGAKGAKFLDHLFITPFDQFCLADFCLSLGNQTRYHQGGSRPEVSGFHLSPE